MGGAYGGLRRSKEVCVADQTNVRQMTRPRQMMRKADCQSALELSGCGNVREVSTWAQVGKRSDDEKVGVN